MEEASEAAAVEVALQRSTPLLSFVFQALIDLVPGESHAHLFFCKKPARLGAFFVRKVVKAFKLLELLAASTTASTAENSQPN